ncbi:MAG: hypothetical protein IKM44_02065 [Clostridia bacterium]|nr:hypothetical protein [Clostridia bacterium]
MATCLGHVLLCTLPSDSSPTVARLTNVLHRLGLVCDVVYPHVYGATLSLVCYLVTRRSTVARIRTNLHRLSSNAVILSAVEGSKNLSSFTAITVKKQ